MTAWYTATGAQQLCLVLIVCTKYSSNKQMAGSLDLADFEYLKQNDQILKLNIEESSHTYCGPTLSRLSSSTRTRALPKESWVEATVSWGNLHLYSFIVTK